MSIKLKQEVVIKAANAAKDMKAVTKKKSQIMEAMEKLLLG